MTTNAEREVFGLPLSEYCETCRAAVVDLLSRNMVGIAGGFVSILCEACVRKVSDVERRREMWQVGNAHWTLNYVGNDRYWLVPRSATGAQLALLDLTGETVDSLRRVLDAAEDLAEIEDDDE